MMTWQEEFNDYFFPYLFKCAKSPRGDVNVDSLNNFLKKILKSDCDIKVLLTIYFLIDETTQNFIRKDLRALLNSLNICSISESKTTKGYVKGKLLINMTIREFKLKQYNPTYYKCKEVFRNFNTPENQFLKYILIKIKNLFERLPKNLIIKTVDDSYDETAERDIKTPKSKFKLDENLKKLKKLSEIISELKHIFMKLINNSKLKALEIPSSITLKMRNRALKSRNKLYQKVDNIYEKFKETFNTGALNEERLKSVVDFQKIVPTTLDKQFEVLNLILVLDSLDSSADFELKNLYLIMSGRDSIANYLYNSHFEIAIFYDQLPKSILKSNFSEYVEIIESYNLGKTPRRPDIILEITNTFNDSKHFFFLEVKRTMKKSYILNSIYKCFAYLYDFKRLFLENVSPKISLLIDQSEEIFKNFDINKRLKRERNVKVFSWYHLLKRNDIIPYMLKNIVNNI